MTTRYGQLSYTSFDAAGTVGGWQVKQTAGGLTTEEIQTLVAGVRTVFNPVRPLPAYPTTQQLADGPRRLAFRRVDRDTAGYWHTVPAGPDSTGRPGNVFAHAVLDRTPDHNPRRPIEWWRSPRWLCPYGPPAVAGAALPEGAPEPGGVVTRESVVTFALDPSTWRLATLLGLLDAVAAALAGGRPVVLGVESTESAAQWIGLVSFLMSAGTAGTLNFSTFDRAEQLGLAVQGKQHLTAVPLADLDRLPPDALVISETDTLWLGELDGQPHRTAGGQTIAVTAWSAMAQVVLLDAESARLVLDDIDHFAAQAGDVGLHPAWPMAMAVTRYDEFADAEAEARAVIAAHSPPGAARDPAVASTISGVMHWVLGNSTRDAWQAVERASPGPAGELADATYLRRAVADDAWLAQPGPIPVSERSFRGMPVPDELDTVLDPAVAAARAAGPHRVLRLADLLIRSGVDDPRVRTAVDAEVVSRLRDAQQGPSLVGGLDGQVGAPTRLALAAALLADADCTDGSVPLPDDVLDWLAAGITAPSAQELAQVQAHDETWTRAALRGTYALRQGATDTADRTAALWWLRTCGSSGFEQMAAETLWPPGDLLAAAGDAVPGAATIRTLMGAADSPELARLANAVLAANDDHVAVACAGVRLIEPQVWVQQGYATTHQAAYTPLWDIAAESVGPEGIHPDCAQRLVTFALIAAASGQPYPSVCIALARDPAAAGTAFAHATALLDAHLLNPAVVLAVAALRWNPDEEIAPTGDPLVDMSWQLANRVLMTRAGAEGVDAGSVAIAMAQLSGDMSDGALRRGRKIAGRLLARGAEAHSSPAIRTRWGR
ncbi:hypothetical protein H7I41_06725 [Mycobacterium manitobense]|uniref:Uncharacterized protein n=1 Tax=[Mycobacterium] manitobense TaxID=190147 RepID=A0A9X2YKW4_9MYCO|nr:hypothetical protein [[Mycobacterium] manitobense]MCV7169614.1 hypothetical protein [[Mycobacterium] manitobense]